MVGGPEASYSMRYRSFPSHDLLCSMEVDNPLNYLTLRKAGTSPWPPCEEGTAVLLNSLLSAAQICLGGKGRWMRQWRVGRHSDGLHGSAVKWAALACGIDTAFAQGPTATARAMQQIKAVIKISQSPSESVRKMGEACQCPWEAVKTLFSVVQQWWCKTT